MPAPGLDPRPVRGVCPLVIVIPSISIAEPAGAADVLNTRLALLPLTVNLDDPGPEIVNGPVISSSPVVSVIVPFTVKLIESAPGLKFALTIATRSEPAPLSLRLETV